MGRFVAVFALSPVAAGVKAPGAARGSRVHAGKARVMGVEMILPVVALHAYGPVAVTALDPADVLTAVHAQSAVGATVGHAEANAAVYADMLVIDVLKAKLAAAAAQVLGLDAAAFKAQAAVVAHLAHGLKAFSAVGAEMRVVGRILAAHAAVRTPVLLAALLAEPAVFAGGLVALVEADQLTGGAELALI